MEPTGRRKWQPTPVLLPGKSYGWRSLVGYSPWGHEESDMTEWLHFHFYALEKEMTTYSSVLAWRIPGMGEPGRPLSMGSHRVGHDWSDLAAAAAWSLQGFPEGSVGEESVCNAEDTGDTGLIPGWEDPLKKEMATHFSFLAWKIPRTEESGRLQSTVSQRVGHNWVTKHTCMSWQGT